MQPLATTRRVMTWLSMCPPNEASNSRQKLAYVAHSWAVLVLNMVCFLASLVFCLKYFLSDFDSAVFAFMIAIVEFGIIYFMVAAFLMRHQIEIIFTSLSTIFKSNENDIAFQYLARANNTSEWMWMVNFKYIAATLVGAAITSLISVLYCYYTHGYFDVDRVYRSHRFVLPWDQTTPKGYFGEMCVVTLIVYAYLILNGTHLLLFISLCMHHQAFYKMFKHSIDKSKKCNANRLCDLIRFYISAKDLFLRSANVYKSFVLVQLICNTVLMTISVFYMDLQWHNADFTMTSVIVTSSVGMSVLFIYCYFGKLATESFAMMPDCAFEMDWHEQPNEVQKYFILMLQNMQKPLYYHGFEVARLDLETFVNLFKKIFSYYITIKTLASK